jgi:hypothetical protein
VVSIALEAGKEALFFTIPGSDDHKITKCWNARTLLASGRRLEVEAA